MICIKWKFEVQLTFMPNLKSNGPSIKKILGRGPMNPPPPLSLPLRLHVWLKGLRLEGLIYDLATVGIFGHHNFICNIHQPYHGPYFLLLQLQVPCIQSYRKKSMPSHSWMEISKRLYISRKYMKKVIVVSKQTERRNKH